MPANTATHWRKTSQNLLPIAKPPSTGYDLYPAFALENGQIYVGFTELAARLRGISTVIIDGYGGVFWEDFRERLDDSLRQQRIRPHWVNAADALRSVEALDVLLTPFLGADDPLFGTRFTGSLHNFFDEVKLAALQPDVRSSMNILYGCGASLAGWSGILIYVDVPKNEIQFRSRAGSIANLGYRQATSAKRMYKQFYFVDWIVLNRHKATLLDQIAWLVDAQRPEQPAFINGDVWRNSLQQMNHSVFRVRPWFEPGTWGGQWLRKHFSALPQAVPNYAWSFELIAPENGVLLVSHGTLLEFAFDWLMIDDKASLIGEAAEYFGTEFPIRFDYLDTFDGGNLSLQCHPRLDYIRTHFGEKITQDETYYIFDCTPDAVVFLGFQATIDPSRFRSVLENSASEGAIVEVEQYIQAHVAHKGDLFLIPSGTVHCSGRNNLVLEISATPYIFTFKMYDWLRLDLDGKARPLNIERAFANLQFERKGTRVQAELIAKPQVIAVGDDWQIVHLPTHPEHFYDVHRLEFAAEITQETAGSVHVLNVVEGEGVRLITPTGREVEFSLAETFIVPAATNHYRLVNMGHLPAKVIKAFIKLGWQDYEQ